MSQDSLLDEIIRHFSLKPLPGEGGWFKEVYRSANVLAQNDLPSGYSGARAYSTAIFYLLTPDSWSALHRLPGDEIYHFYLGDSVELLQLYPDGSSEVVVLGPDFRTMKLQHVAPGGAWQGSRLKPGGRFALMGTTMSPGFDFADFESAQSLDASLYSQHSELIRQLSETPASARKAE